MYSWGHYNIQYNQKAIEPLGEAVSNTELFRRLARVFLFGDDVFTRDDDEIMSKAMLWDHKNLDGITLQSLTEQGFARDLMLVMQKTGHHIGTVNFQQHRESLNLSAHKVKLAETCWLCTAKVLMIRKNTLL